MLIFNSQLVFKKNAFKSKKKKNNHQLKIPLVEFSHNPKNMVKKYKNLFKVNLKFIYKYFCHLKLLWKS